MKPQFDKRKSSNIILTGFMGAGKSTVAKILQKNLQLVLLDSDKEIEKKAGLSIPEIFKQGEKKFRDLETSFLKNNLKISSTVLAVGGGILEKTENIALLQKIGVSYFLQTPFEQLWNELASSKNRPMIPQEFSDEEKKNFLKKLYQKRLTKYQTADFTVGMNPQNQKTTSVTVEQIVAQIKIIYLKLNKK